MSNRTEYSELTKTELLHDFYALQARLDEAVALLREIHTEATTDVMGLSRDGALDLLVGISEGCSAFLSTLDNGGA